jgi:arabinose-5-phosphate isomerase
LVSKLGSKDFDGDKMLALARHSIQLESDTLLAVRDHLGQSFLDCLVLIGEASGRIVLTGVGKSAIIGQKLAATFSSTGTPALFLHAGDAIHGDLGMLRKGDVILCLSKSGETQELKNLVPILKNLGHPLMAIVSNDKSYLARQADHCIIIPIKQESDPNNLAPTASTMAQLAIGDALASCLILWKKFKPYDFAQLHPGGSLGKKLHLKVRSICTRQDCPQVFVDDPVNKVIIEISGKRLGATAVLDAQSQVVGIITDGDLRRMLQHHAEFQDLKAIDIMTSTPKTIEMDTLAMVALEVMELHQITQLLVIENNQYQGIIHIHDILREGLS